MLSLFQLYRLSYTHIPKTTAKDIHFFQQVSLALSYGSTPLVGNIISGLLCTIHVPLLNNNPFKL